VVGETKHDAAPVGLTFKSTHCEEISYRIEVSRDKFDVERFRSSLIGVGKKLDRYGTVCAPKDPKNGDFHLHAEWFIEEDEINFRIDYEEGPKEHEDDEQEPYAEQFMEWLGQFFKNDNAHAHIHAEFVYPLEARKSRFPLPLKTVLGPEGSEAEINGISLSFPSKPEGVGSYWLMRMKKRWRVQLAADRRVTFKGFTPYRDMRAFVSVIEMVMEDKKS
jgi:hypothetical protein